MPFAHLRRHLQFCAAFRTEAGVIFYWLRALRAEQIGQGQFRAAVLAKLSRRPHTAAHGTHHRLWITRRAEASERRRCHRLLYLWHRCLLWNTLWHWPLRLEHIGFHGRRDSICIELWSAIIGFDLLSLRLDIHLMLELRTVGFHIGSAARAGAEVQFRIEAAHTDRAMAFGAEVKFVLDAGPGLLQRVGLFRVPL